MKQSSMNLLDSSGSEHQHSSESESNRVKEDTAISLSPTTLGIQRDMLLFNLKTKKYDFFQKNVFAGGAVDGAGDEDSNHCCYPHERQQQPLAHAHYPPAQTGKEVLRTLFKFVNIINTRTNVCCINLHLYKRL